jgi:hypothetical protein
MTAVFVPAYFHTANRVHFPCPRVPIDGKLTGTDEYKVSSDGQTLTVTTKLVKAHSPFTTVSDRNPSRANVREEVLSKPRLHLL